MLCGRRLEHVRDEPLGLGGTPHDAQARRELELGAVPVRLAQPSGEGLLVETDGALLVTHRVLDAGQLEDEAGVARMAVDELLRSSEPTLLVVALPQRRDLGLELVLAASGDDLAADRPCVVDLAAVLADPAVHLGPLRVAHQGDDVTVQRVRHEGLEGLELGAVAGDVERADLGEALAEQPEQVLGLASAQVVPGHLEGDLLGAPAGDLTHGDDGLVGAVTGTAEAETHGASGGGQTSGDLEQCLEARPRCAPCP